MTPPAASGRPPAGVTGGRKRPRLLTGLVLAMLVATVVVVGEEITHPHHNPPTEGRAIAVPGQPTNVLPDPDFLGSCSTTGYDTGTTCTTQVVDALDNARLQQNLAPLTLPGNWQRLTPAEQIFVATNLERTARALTPITGMTGSLDTVAQQGATTGEDPPLTAGGSLTTVAGNWIQGYSNPLEALYQWVYDDGLGSTNVDCTRQDLAGCWTHRANVLVSCATCALGAGFATTDQRGESLSYAEVIVDSQAPLPFTFTWTEEQPYLTG